jgi:hypothetical protein
MRLRNSRNRAIARSTATTTKKNGRGKEIGATPWITSEGGNNNKTETAMDKKTAMEMLSELIDAQERGVKFVTYGDGDLGVPVTIEDAIDDVAQMDDDMIGNGFWQECCENGQPIW